MATLPLPRGAEGLASLTELPSDGWTERWDRIIVPESIKDRLVNFGAFFFGPRAHYSTVGVPVHGLIVLQGPPGVGKTTLAGGLAAKLAETVDGRSLLFLVIDAHALPSQLLGESQRSVARLFERTLPDLAAPGRPIVVLLDEVEALAVNREGASLETNPVDVHRATEAVLTGMDQVSAACSNVLFVATTNHAAGVDRAFLSRADLIEDIGLPGVEAMDAILRDTLREIRPAFASFDPRLHAFAVACHERGLDARRLRKLVVRALVRRRELAVEPALLKIDDLEQALDEDAPWSAPVVSVASQIR
jgi:pachytene checkpoint protein 2